MRANALIAMVVAAVASAMPSGQSRNTPAAAAISGEILVKFSPGASAAAKNLAHAQGRGRPIAEISRTNLQRVAVSPGDESAAIARYENNPNVVLAEPNYIRRIPKITSHASGSAVVAGDFYFREQWALHNTGQEFYCIDLFGDGTTWCLYFGTPDADIDAPEAWALSMGSDTLKVAVIDSGIDYLHPDLAANYAGGYNFIDGNENTMDEHGHGTHVSGTIAALINNPSGDPPAPEGVAGVAPRVRLLMYKVCHVDGTCDDFAIQSAIARAIADGAKVINMSLGESAFSQSFNEAVQDAWTAGLVIVAGAGNDGTTDAFYPAGFDNVISVAAFDEDHRRASFSNYGDWVDMSAPGNVIMSTYPLAACGGSSTNSGDTGCYTWSSGTSMATPHVSGAAALVWSRSDVSSNSQVVQILQGSADPRGVASTRLDTWTRHGGLNIHDALSYGAVAPPPATDVVTILKAAYNSRRRQLTVEANSSDAPNALLTAFDNSNSSSPLELGPLSYNSKRGRYTGTFTLASQPSSILVTSSAGGSAVGQVSRK